MLQKQRELKLKQAIKIGLACLNCILINYFGKLPLAFDFFSVLTVFVIYTVYPQQVFQKAIERICGITVASICVYFVIHWFHAYPLVYCLTILLLAYGAGAFIPYKHGYAFLLGGIIGSVIMLRAFSSTEHETLALIISIDTQLALAFLSIIFFEVVFPIYNRASIKSSLKFIGKCCTQYLDCFSVEHKDVPTTIKEEDFELLRKQIKHARGLSFKERKHYRKLIALAEEFVYELRILKSTYLKFYSSKLHKHYQAELDDIFNSLKLQLQKLSKSAHLSNHLEKSYEQLSSKIYQERTHGKFRQYEYSEVLSLLSINGIIKQIIDTINSGISKKLLSNKKPKNKFSLAHTTGFRLVLILVIIMGGMVIFHWQNALQMTVAAMVMAIQTNVGKSIAKMKYRLLGIVLGGITVSVFLIILHFFPFLLIYIALLFISLIGFAYIGLGNERYAYIGIQAGLIIPMVLMGSDIATGNIHLAISRMIAVFQGSAIGIIGILVFKPSFPIKNYKQQRKELLNQYQVYFTKLSNGIFLESPINIINDMNDSLIKTREAVNDLSHMMSKKKIAQEKIKEIIPILFEININICVCNMMLQDQKVCQQALKRLSPACLVLADIFASINRLEIDGRLTNRISQLENTLNDNMQQLRTEKLTANENLEVLDYYGLFLMAFVNIVAAIKKYPIKNL